MIKSVVSAPVGSDQFSYPALRRSKSAGYIVLFNSADSGMVVHTPNKHVTAVGYFNYNWNSLEKNWETLPPGSKVTLTVDIDE